MKKKILSILLCGVACVAASSALPSQYAKYDLNGDGQLTADDASVIYSYILGTADEAVTLAQADVNGDGTVNTADVVEVYVAVRDFVHVTGISLDKSSLSLMEGYAAQLMATINPSDATDKTITWSSDDKAVATVDADGKVTAMAPGTATITVTTADGGFTATCIVKVREKGIEGWGYDSDDSEFGGAKERRGTWGNLRETEN